MLEIILTLVVSILFGVLTITRLHEKPILLRLPRLTETASNSYTERQDDVPVRSAGRGKIQALELMKVHYFMGIPSIEPGESNNTIFHISTETKAAVTNVAEDEDILLFDQVGVRSEDATAIELNVTSLQGEVLSDDLTDGDGNGQLWFSRDMFVGVQGIGNASARTIDVWFLYYLVEVDGEDIIQQILND